MVTFSSRLTQFRKQNSLSQDQAGKLLGVTGKYIGMLERGDKEVEEESTISKLLAIYEENPPGVPLPNDARAALQEARLRKGWSMRELSEKTGYSVGVLQALEQANGRGSERLLEKLSQVLEIPLEDLMRGCEPKIIDPTGMTGTMGAKPNVVAGPGVGSVRYIPKISFAQAGTMGAWDDGAYEYEAFLAADVKDPKAFAVEIRGDSMEDKISEGDVAIIYPSFQPRNGGVVLARLNDDHEGYVFCKIFSSTNGGRDIVLTSYNDKRYPPIQYKREDFSYIYPVASVTKLLLYK